MSRIAPLLLATSLLSSFSAASIGFDCRSIVNQKVRWNLGELGGPRVVHWVQEGDPTSSDYTFALDICKPLKKHEGVGAHNECPGNTRVCGVEYIHNIPDNITTVAHVVPIAGDYFLKTGQHLESEVKRLKDSESNADSNKEGLRLELSGGREQLEKKGSKKQKAIIEFLCDPSTDGKDTEVDDRPEAPGGDDEDEGKERRKREEKAKSLTFVSYKDEKVKDEDWGVLRLEWKTKYACENAVDAPKENSGSWGFFTWLIIILFLATSSYLIFGSWLNYNRYGARGWDALPHGDTLRDLPYIMSDFSRKVTSTIQGGGSRGGYSAV